MRRRPVDPSPAVAALVDAVAAAVPGAAVSVDPALVALGHSFVDVERGGRTVVVEHRPAADADPYGVTLLRDDGDDYGAGPDEVFATAADAAARVAALLG